MSGVTAAVFLNQRHQEMCGQLLVLSDLLAGNDPGTIRHEAALVPVPGWTYGQYCPIDPEKSFRPFRNSNLDFQLVHTLAWPIYRLHYLAHKKHPVAYIII
jgi:hypothetical protein